MCRPGEAAGLVQRSKEELLENFRNYLGQFLETEDTENVLMTNEFLDEQERIVKTGERRSKEAEKSSAGFAEEEGGTCRAVGAGDKGISETADQS